MNMHESRKFQRANAKLNVNTTYHGEPFVIQNSIVCKVMPSSMISQLFKLRIEKSIIKKIE